MDDKEIKAYKQDVQNDVSNILDAPDDTW
jgi:hypothetical protein